MRKGIVTLLVWIVICNDKSIHRKYSDIDRRVDTIRDGFIFTATIQSTEIYVLGGRHLQP